jgi:hypothetical protein
LRKRVWSVLSLLPLLGVAPVASDAMICVYPCGDITVILTSPSEGAVVSGPLRIEGEATASSPIAEVQFSVVPRGGTPTGWEVVPSTSLAPVGGDPAHQRFRHDHPSRALPNGEFTVIVRALDSSIPQSTSEAASANVTIDNTPPAVTLEAPGGVAAGAIEIRGQVEPVAAGRVASLVVLVAGNPQVSAAAAVDPVTGRFAARLDVSPLPDGEHQVVALATYDGSERVTSAPVRISVRNPLPVWLLTTLGIALAAVVILAVVFAAWILEVRRLRAAGFGPRNVLREPAGWRMRRFVRRAGRVYGVPKREGGAGTESIRTLDAVELLRRPAGAGKDAGRWRPQVLGKLTWRQADARGVVTVFETEQTSERRAIPERLLSLARKQMRRGSLEELRFEVRDSATAEARAAALARVGAREVGDRSGKGVRAREFVLRR